jgi:DNA polymerase-3 subunit epsilon
LGKLCQSVGIEIQDRHRARGDAQATVTLFQKIYLVDTENIIQKTIQVKAKEQRIPTNIPSELINNLPSTAGVYLFKNSAAKIIYVGKANNIKKRVISHFTGNNTGQRRQSFINEICDIDFEETGTELMAFLKECHLIKKIWPIYNRALKKYEPKYGLLDYEDQNGYIRLSICQVRKNVRPIYFFGSVHDSTQFLLKLIKDFELDLRLCSFFANPTALKEVRDFTAREDLPQVEEYNNKVTQAIESLTEQKRSFVIIDKGRESTEKSYVYFKDNKVHALGFIDNELEFDDIEDLITQDNLVVHNFYMNHLVESFARLFPSKVMHLKGLPLEVDSPVNDVIY